MRSPFKKKVVNQNSCEKMGFVADSNYQRQNELAQRRKLRLLQVRKMASVASNKIRQRVQTEQHREVKRLAHQELEKYIAAKTDELAMLESEYQRALAVIGLGHEGLQEEAEYEAWKREQQRLQDEVAGVRGDHALKVVKYRSALDMKLKQNKIGVKQSVLLAEKLRATQIRSRLKPNKLLNKVEVIEIDTHAKDYKKVRFIDRQEVVDSNVKGQVKNLRQEAKVGDGLEGAIQEQEAKYPDSSQVFQPDKDHEDSIREKLQRMSPGDSKVPMPDPDWRWNQRIPYYDPPDPRIQPSSEDTTDNSSQNKIGEETFEDVERRFQALLRKGSRPQTAEDIRLQPIPEEQSDLDLTPMRGPSASSDFSTSSSLHATVTQKKQDMPGAMIDQDQGLIEKNFQEGQGAKNTEADRDFIAQILKGVNISKGDLVNIRVNVEECSTTAFGSRDTSGSVQASSSASIDITTEKFLTDEWGRDAIDNAPIRGLIRDLRQNDDRQQYLRFYIERLLRMKRQEIADLSVTTTTDGSDSVSIVSSSRKSQITSVSSSSVPNSSTLEMSGSAGFYSSTPASILSSSSDSRSSLPKTVRFQLAQGSHEGTFRSSSSSKKAEDKKQQILDQTKLNLEEVSRQYQEQRKFIEMELEKRRIRKEQESAKKILPVEVPEKVRMKIEPPKESALRRASLSESAIRRTSLSESSLKRHQKGKENREPVMSEGPLSSLSLSSSSSQRSSSLSTISTSYLENLTRSTSSSSSSDKVQLKSEDMQQLKSEREAKIQTQKRIRKLQFGEYTEKSADSPKLAFLLANKSSSSGTSGSTATADFLARLREMEMPTLSHPTPEQLMQQLSGQNTSSDVAKLKELESNASSEEKN